MAVYQKIKSKLNLNSHRKSILLLKGEYLSMLRGKSLDFDDLREYTYGDDVRDIDWRASAKHDSLLVKRYIANRRHNILFILDSSITMIAAAPDYQAKYELATEIMGMLGFIAISHNDGVGLLTFNNGEMESLPFKNGEKHLNRILDRSLTVSKESSQTYSTGTILEAAYRHNKNQTIFVFITDKSVPDSSLEPLIKKINHKHDFLWLTVSDINPVVIPKTYEVKDVEDIIQIPEGLREDLELIEEIHLDEINRQTNMTDFLKSLHVANVTVNSSDDILPQMIKLLKRRANEKTRRTSVV